jgi:hypothetical protein
MQADEEKLDGALMPPPPPKAPKRNPLKRSTSVRNLQSVQLDPTHIDQLRDIKQSNMGAAPAGLLPNEPINKLKRSKSSAFFEPDHPDLKKQKVRGQPQRQSAESPSPRFLQPQREGQEVNKKEGELHILAPANP